MSDWPSGKPIVVTCQTPAEVTLVEFGDILIVRAITRDSAQMFLSRDIPDDMMDLERFIERHKQLVEAAVLRLQRIRESM